jgi:dTDP-4-dehydrorhamnose reductase
MALKTAERFNLDAGLIQPITTKELGQAADRPLRGGLNINRAEKMLKTRLLSFDDGLRLMGNSLFP